MCGWVGEPVDFTFKLCYVCPAIIGPWSCDIDNMLYCALQQLLWYAQIRKIPNKTTKPRP